MPDWRPDVRRALAGAAADAPGIRERGPGVPADWEEIVAELVHHLDDRYRQSLSEGLTEAEAKARALDELAGAHALVEELVRKDQARPAVRPPQTLTGDGIMRRIWQDVRYASRMLRKDPAFTLVAAITLALGIGANGAIFSVVHAVLLRELPYPSPHELVMVWESRPREGVYDNVVSPADFLDWRARQQTFADIAALSATPVTLTGAGTPDRVPAANVSASFFSVLGVAPAIGRSFAIDNERAGRDDVVIVGHGFWQRRFGAAPDIVGRRIVLDGRPREVIGVLPASFRFPDEAIELWLPIDFTTEPMRARFNHFLTVIARLKPGVTLDGAQQEMDAISAQLQREVVLQNQGHGSHVIAFQEQLVGKVRPSLLVLTAAAAFILLIACVNVASLLLARGAARGKEVALRCALGAGRGRIVQQLVTECAALAALAAIVAVPLTMWGTRALTSLVPAEVPRLNDAGVNPAVLAFMAAVALATAVLFSLAPAWQMSQLNLSDTLKESAASGGLSRRRLRKGLVVAEIALAFVLLVSAGLMTRTLINLLNVDAGFQSENVLTVPLAWPRQEGATPQRNAALFTALLDGIRSYPGVHAAGLTSHVPMSGNDSRIGIGVEGREATPGEEPVRAHWRVVTAGYFDAMQIRLLRGRFPTAAEVENGSPVAIINRTAADRYWRDVDPLGKRVRVVTPDLREIIGIVDDVRHWGPGNAVNPEVYLPGFRNPATVIVRAEGNPAALAGTIRQQIQTLSPETPVAGIRTMAEIRSRSVASPRFYLVLLTTFAAVALILAVVGVYGVVSHHVAQSRGDVGVRLAIGARASDVMRVFLDEAVMLTGLGIALGVAGALAFTRLLAALLFGVTPTDAWTFSAIAVLTAIVALAACYLPARRASNLDPLITLRDQR